VELRDLTLLVWRRWWLLVAGTALAIAVYFIALRYVTPPPQYQAASTVVVGGDSEIDVSALQLGRDLVPTYVEWARRRPVLQSVIDALKLDESYKELQERIDVRAIRDTQLMEITVTSSDPQQAAAIANEVALQLTFHPLPFGGGADATQRSFQLDLEALRRKIESTEAEIVDLSDRATAAGSEEDVAALTGRIAGLQQDLNVWRKSLSVLDSAYADYLGGFIRVAEEAVPPSQPLKPTVHVFVVGTVGFLFAALLAFLLERLNPSSKKTDDLFKHLAIPALGEIPSLNGSGHGWSTRLFRRQAGTDRDPLSYSSKHGSPFDSSYRNIVNNLMCANDGGMRRTVLITSPTAEHGQENTAVGIAMACAAAGHRTVLVDASLQHPVLHFYFGLPNATGLVDLLNKSERAQHTSLLNPVGKNGLQVLTSGPVKFASPRIFHPQHFEAGLDELSEQADVILFNGPPVLAGPEAASLASQVDYVVLTFDAQKTRFDEVQKAASLLKASKDTQVGGVLNNGHAAVAPISTQPAGGFRWPRTFRALRHRNFRLFWFGQVVSQIGTWMQIVAQGWLVYTLTESAFLLGLVNFVGLLPVIPISLLGGVISDRISRRNLIIGTEAVLMVQALIMATLTWLGLIQVWHIIILSFVLGAAAALEQPARLAFVADTAGKDDLTNAVALNASVYNSARIVGPAVAGLLVAWIGEAGCFFVNGVSYLAVIGALLAIRLPREAIRETGLNVGRSLVDGLNYVWDAQLIRDLMAIVAVSSFFTLPYITLLPVFAADVLNVGPEGLGLLLTTIGLGAIIGALGVANVHSGHRGRWLALGNVLGPVFLILFSISGSLPLSLALVFLVGASNAVRNTLANSMIQLSSLERYHGRVMSVYNLLFNGMSRFGALMIGGLAQVITVPWAVGLGAVVSVIWGLIVIWRMPSVVRLR
jgi:capsular exopolysaccharide synthesis family protein